MSFEQEDDGQTAASDEIRLLVARGDLAEARALRLIGSCATSADEVREPGADQDLLDRHALRARTMLAAERLIQSQLPGEVDLGDTLTRYATHFLIGSEVMTELRTSAGLVLVGGEVCRWMMMVAAELLHAVESTSRRCVECKASIVIDHRDHGIVMSVIAHGAQRYPVPRRSGVEAIARASRVMKLLGDFATSSGDGDVAYVATFRGGRESAGS